MTCELCAVPRACVVDSAAGGACMCDLGRVARKKPHGSLDGMMDGFSGEIGLDGSFANFFAKFAGRAQRAKFREIWGGSTGFL